MLGAGLGQSSPAGRRKVDFENPPVTETILGVQFLPLRAVTLPYIAVFWADVRSRYPRHEVKAPLSPVIEDMSTPQASLQLGIALSSEPDARFWFIDESGTQLIQVQRDRFIRNWRKRERPYHDYLRYDDLRPRFEQDFREFVGFLERESLGTPQINQCEVTYINHIEFGEGWQSLGQAHEVLTLLKPQQREYLPEPEVVVLTAGYLIPGLKGRLHIATQPAIRVHDGKHGLQLTLTARGTPASSRLEDILEWFDRGHDAVVHGFVDMTTEKMHRLWRRR